MYEDIKEQAKMAAAELLDKANLTKGQILVVGCSSSEIIGSRIGSASSPEVAEAVWEGIFEAASSRGVFVAAQWCEHLNRAIIVERAAVPGADIVNVVPQPKAGGSFATAAYAHAADPVAVEEIRADEFAELAGMIKEPKPFGFVGTIDDISLVLEEATE